MKMRKTIMLALSVVILLTLAACSNIDEGPEESAFHGMDHLTHYNGLRKYDQKDTMYLIYVYSVTCPACTDIIPDVLEFIETHGDEIPIVFDHGAGGQPPVNVTHVPTFIVMKAGEVLDGPIVGPQPIRELFEDIEEGVYNP